jgi:hypothetical protein
LAAEQLDDAVGSRRVREATWQASRPQLILLPPAPSPATHADGEPKSPLGLLVPLHTADRLGTPAHSDRTPAKQPLQQFTLPSVETSLGGLEASARPQPPPLLCHQSARGIAANDPHVRGTPTRAKPLVVYTRRRQGPGARNRTASASATPTVEFSTPVEVASQDSFINKITKFVGMLLPVPKINKRRRKPPPSREPPRRSRRIADLQAQQGHATPSQPKRRVMHFLGFDDTQQQHLCQQIQGDYDKLLLHLLSDIHVQALASLFGWTVPVNLNGGKNGVSIS